jgi:S1-C subfamily serine protease
MRARGEDDPPVLELGDIIVAVDEHAVQRNEDLVHVLDKFDLDATVQLTLQRPGQTVTIPVQLSLDLATPARGACRALGYL